MTDNQIDNVAGIVRVHGREPSDHIALVQDERTMSWGELLMRSAQMAQALSRRRRRR